MYSKSFNVLCFLMCMISRSSSCVLQGPPVQDWPQPQVKDTALNGVHVHLICPLCQHPIPHLGIREHMASCMMEVGSEQFVHAHAHVFCGFVIIVIIVQDLLQCVQMLQHSQCKGFNKKLQQKEINPPPPNCSEAFQHLIHIRFMHIIP